MLSNISLLCKWKVSYKAQLLSSVFFLIRNPCANYLTVILQVANSSVARLLYHGVETKIYFYYGMQNNKRSPFPILIGGPNFISCI